MLSPICVVWFIKLTYPDGFSPTLYPEPSKTKPEYATICPILVAGVFSCIILDILGFLMKFFGIPEPSWAVVGRWTYYMLKKAKFYNPNIAEMASFKYEVVLGWLFHY